MTQTLPQLWPSTLPQRARYRGAGGAFEPGLSGFQPEEGLALRRPTQTASIERHSVPLPQMTLAQYETFLEFGETSLGRWSQPFAFIHPVRGAIRKVWFQAAARPFSIERQGAYVNITLALEWIDVTPWFADQLTIANGFIEVIAP